MAPSNSVNIDLNRLENDPVVKLVNSLLIKAVHLDASDLHFEPYAETYRIRFRIDGVLRQITELSTQLIAKVSARLKIMANMDISERRLPQDGRIKIKAIDNVTLNFRASTLPTLFGEKIVLRVINSVGSMVGVSNLGFEPDQEKTFLSALHQPQGIILITGPTGSGKSFSLYTALDILNTDGTNISSVEDPIEIHLPGVNQVNMNAQIGLSFDRALKSFLRQDPDVVMVGEIRDIETADTAIRAAQTGHLVLSTLHTNSAAETLARLHYMGIAQFNIATAISLVVAQRLARKLCLHCKKQIDVPSTCLLQMGFVDQDLAKLQHEEAVIYEAVGCEHCLEGYKGRIGIFEVMPVTEDLSQLIMQGGNAIDIKVLAKQQGFYDLKRASILKVLQGVISIQEMNRVIAS